MLNRKETEDWRGFIFRILERPGTHICFNCKLVFAAKATVNISWIHEGMILKNDERVICSRCFKNYCNGILKRLKTENVQDQVIGGF